MNRDREYLLATRRYLALLARIRTDDSIETLHLFPEGAEKIHASNVAFRHKSANTKLNMSDIPNSPETAPSRGVLIWRVALQNTDCRRVAQLKTGR